MKNWNELSDYEQVILFWEYLANYTEDDDEFYTSFQEFDTMMKELTER